MIYTGIHFKHENISHAYSGYIEDLDMVQNFEEFYLNDPKLKDFDKSLP